MRRIDILNKSYQNFLLNIPIPALKNHTLREVFENRNMAMPDLTGATHLGNGVYRLFVQFGITVDYDTLSGIWTINGTTNSNLWILQKAFGENITHNVSYYYVSGSMTNAMAIGFYDVNTSGVGGFISAHTDSYTQNKNVESNPTTVQLLVIPINSSTFNNFKFKLQLEKGSTATPYQVPTNGPYNDIDISTFGLTNAQIDYWYKVFRYFRYQEFTPGISYPNFFIPTDPTGFGNRYSLLELNKIPYGQELDFDNIQLNLVMGINNNPYTIYNKLMNFLIDNECILEYDYGQGVRYTDVRLINAPKTEMEQGRIIRSKFDFKRITPFYTILQGSTVEVINTHDWKIKPIVEGTVNTNTVYIEAEDLQTTEMLTVKFDFTSVTKPFDFYYNAETKQILINGVNIGYKYIDLAYGKTFLELEKDIHYEVTTTGITNPIVTIKKWVID